MFDCVYIYNYTLSHFGVGSIFWTCVMTMVDRRRTRTMVERCPAPRSITSYAVTLISLPAEKSVEVQQAFVEEVAKKRVCLY